MKRLVALAFVLGVALLGSVAPAQQPKKGASASKKPETSSAADFKPEEMTKLAVIVSRGDKDLAYRSTQHSDPARLVEDAFLECLLAKGHMVSARSDIDSVLREKKFQESGATDDLA